MADQDDLAETGDDGNFLTKLPAILWERRWFVIIPVVLSTIAGAAAALLLPATYESRAVVLVESQSLIGQQDFDQGDSEIDRRIAKIRQQLMSRPDLVELIQTNNLYNASSRAEPLSKLVDRLRDNTEIRAVDADVSPGARGRAQSSIAFALTVTYPRPDLAQLVAQTFIDRLLKLSATQSQAEAANSVRVLEDQADTLQQRLTSIESSINQITGQNGAALASAQSFGSIGGGGNYDGQIAQLERENAQLRLQTGGTALERDPTVINAEAQLAAVRAQYSDDHPDVKLAESRLAAARANASQLQSRAVSGQVQAQINANNTAISQLRQARNLEQSRANQLAAAQSRGPKVAAQVTQLQSEAEQLRTNLGKVNTSLLSARSAAKLADEQRGERLTLIEPPPRPDRPSSPNRPLLAIGGLLGGIALGAGLALVIEMLMRPIRSVAAIRRVTGAAPLAVVPVLSKRPFRARGWKRFRLRLPFRRAAKPELM